MRCGGIDLGGTKIEARLFDGDQTLTIEKQRVPTPKTSYDAMFDALVGQIDWLLGFDPDLPIGIALPGVIDTETQVSFASNIPTTGRSLGPDLARHYGREMPVVNDCMAFAFSEATGGAAQGAPVTMGLILGTGVGGGICIDGAVPPRHAGLAVEIGHVGIPARALARHDLPLWPCGCGRQACFENYISGTGLSNLSEWLTGQRLSGETIARAETAETRKLMQIWADLTGECLDVIQLTLDPDSIVLGGGLSNIDGVADLLTARLETLRLGDARLPTITTAQHGDSSGARGAALIAIKDRL
ncbi:MAG: ROK family protein [Pelagimonas sp.]|jgi:N-acetylglucosamine kinase|nr:ROK family protein [Pelagimonas sp.]